MFRQTEYCPSYPADQLPNNTMKISNSTILLTFMQLFSQAFVTTRVTTSPALSNLYCPAPPNAPAKGVNEENILFDLIPDNCLIEAYNLGEFMTVHVILTAVPANDDSHRPAIGLHGRFGENQDDPHKHVFEIAMSSWPWKKDMHWVNSP